MGSVHHLQGKYLLTNILKEEKMKRDLIVAVIVICTVLLYVSLVDKDKLAVTNSIFALLGWCWLYFDILYKERAKK